MNAKPNTWQKVFRLKKSKWPDPQISVGQFYRMVGDMSCWEATNLARKAFSQVAEEIRDYLEKYSNPVSDEVTWTMYMIGRTKESSEPTIMFCGRNTKCRKYVRKAVKESGIMDKHPGIRLGDAPRPPDFDQLVQLGETIYQRHHGIRLGDAPRPPNFDQLVQSGETSYQRHPGSRLGNAARAPDLDQLVQLAGLSFQDLTSIDSSTHMSNIDQQLKRDIYSNGIAFGLQMGSLYGKKLTIPYFDNKHRLKSVRHATGGGVVYEGDRHFYLTAGHAFIPRDISPLPSECEDLDDYSFDLSEGNASDEDECLVSTTSRGSTTPEIDDSITSNDSTSSSNPQPHSTNPFPDFEIEPRLVSGENSSTTLESPRELSEQLHGLVAVGRLCQMPIHSTISDLDYSLIEHISGVLDDDKKFPTLFLSGHLMNNPRDTPVTSITASAGIMSGMLSGTPTYKIATGSRKSTELWTVRFKGTLREGDCGSWVTDEESGDFVGHIVAGSPRSGVAYIVPAYKVFAEVRERYGLDLTLFSGGSNRKSKEIAHSNESGTSGQPNKLLSIPESWGPHDWDSDIDPMGLQGRGLSKNSIRTDNSDSVWSQVSWNSHTAASPIEPWEEVHSYHTGYQSPITQPSSYDTEAAIDARPTPTSLGWSQNSPLLEIYTFVVENAGKDPYFQLVDGYHVTPQTPARVYLDSPRHPINGPYPCQYPWGCSWEQTVFNRLRDLERHYKNVHTLSGPFSCDYQKCGRFNEPFTRKAHYLDHLRDYHKEDLGSAIVQKNLGTKQWAAEQVAWLVERRVSPDWWRCARCLARRHVQTDGWNCPVCKVSCKQDRIDIRRMSMNTAEARGNVGNTTNPNSVAKIDYARGVVACGNCQDSPGWVLNQKGDAWVACDCTPKQA